MRQRAIEHVERQLAEEGLPSLSEYAAQNNAHLREAARTLRECMERDPTTLPRKETEDFLSDVVSWYGWDQVSDNDEVARLCTHIYLKIDEPRDPQEIAKLAELVERV